MLMNGKQYIESLRKMRPNIYKFGKLIEDVTTDPNTALHVKSVARSYDAAFDPERAPIYTAKSTITGEVAHRWNTFMGDEFVSLPHVVQPGIQFRLIEFIPCIAIEHASERSSR